MNFINHVIIFTLTGISIILVSPYALATDIFCQEGINEYCMGTGFDDQMIGNNESNKIHGLGGNDSMSGYAGDDIMYGNDGDDWIGGIDGNDLLYGGKGNDRILGYTGNDKIFGEEGDDQLFGGYGADEIHGGEGNDDIYHSYDPISNPNPVSQPNYDPKSSDGYADWIDCGEGYDKVFYNSEDGDIVTNSCEEKHDGYNPPEPVPHSRGEDCDRAEMCD